MTRCGTLEMIKDVQIPGLLNEMLRTFHLSLQDSYMSFTVICYCPAAECPKGKVAQQTSLHDSIFYQYQNITKGGMGTSKHTPSSSGVSSTSMPVLWVI